MAGSRTLSEGMLNAFRDKSRMVVHLVDVILDTGTLRLTDAFMDIPYGGYTYQRLGHFLGFDGIEESSALQVNDCRMSLSIVDQAWLAYFLTESYLNRQVKIYVGIVDASFALISTPVLMLHGYMDEPMISEDPETGKSVASVRIVNHLADTERTNGRYTNTASQTFWYPGDMFFEQAWKATVVLPSINYR
jgi:hypothetical protein